MPKEFPEEKDQATTGRRAIRLFVHFSEVGTKRNR